MAPKSAHIVVTGASGFVGRELVRALAAAGSTGIAVSRRRMDTLPAGWQHHVRQEGLDWTPAARPTAVIHLEARHHQYVVGEGSPEQVAEFTKTNLGNTTAWLDWCARVGVHRFVYFSSVKAVDPSRWTGEGAIDETAPGPGASIYGRSKWMAEQRVIEWAGPDRSALILRPAVIYGPGNTANMASMVAAIARRRFVFVGANDNVKSLVSLRNAVAATVHLLTAMRPGREIYNLVDARRCSVRELAGIIARQLGVPPPSATVPLALARPVAQVADAFGRLTRVALPVTGARLAALCEHADFSPAKLLATGFRHPQTLEEGLAEMSDAYRRTP